MLKNISRVSALKEKFGISMRPCNILYLSNLPQVDTLHYKKTKIIQALWLAERSVCVRVCKHACGVKMFCCSRANHASTNLKKFSSSKLDKFTLFTHSFVGWNLENRREESVSRRKRQPVGRSRTPLWRATCEWRPGQNQSHLNDWLSWIQIFTTF